MSDQVLYRFYSSTGQLLYIGVSMDPPTRFKDHRKLKDWWAQVSGITVETYPDRASVLDAERRAIKIEHPQYNVQHNTGRTMSAVKAPVSRRLVWTCDACRRPIKSGDGYLWVDRDRAVEAMAEIQKWNDQARLFLSRADLENIPHQALWRVHHRSCDPEPRGDHYWYDVERLDTWEGIFDFLAHVTEKTWVTGGTGVSTLMRKIGYRFGKS